MEIPRPSLSTSRASSQSFYQILWATSFDLHVLGMPPAFILSQDQTLIKKIYFKFFLATQILTFYLVFKDRFTSPILTSALVIYQVLFPLSTFFVSFLTFSLFFTWHIPRLLRFLPYFWLSPFHTCSNIILFLLLCKSFLLKKMFFSQFVTFLVCQSTIIGLQVQNFWFLCQILTLIIFDFLL